MIHHGILAGNGICGMIIQEIKKFSDFDLDREHRKINWHVTRVFDNSNRGRAK